MRSSLLAAVLAVSFILAASIGLFFLLQGGGRIEPLDGLPDGTLFVVHAVDPPAFARSLARTRLLPADIDGAEGCWAPAAALLSGALKRRGIEIDLTADDLSRAFAAEIVLALVPAGDLERPGLALIATAPGDPGKILAALQDLARKRIPAFSESWLSTRRHRHDEYLMLRVPGGSGPLCIAVRKRILVATTSGASMRAILDTVGGRGSSLRSSAVFRETLERPGRGADLVAFGSGSWIRSLAVPSSRGGEHSAIARLLGTPIVRGASLVIQAKDDLFHERLRVSLAGEARDLAVRMFGSEPHAPRPGRLSRSPFPFFATLSTAGLDPMFERLPDLASSATRASALQLQTRLAGLEEFLSIDLKRDLLAAFGDEIAVGFGHTSTWPRGAADRQVYDTPALASIGLRDPDAASRFLGRIDGLARALASYRTRTIGGETITFYEIPSIAPLRPSYRISGTHLVAATSPDLLAGAAGAAAQEQAVRGNEEIDAILDKLPHEAHIFLGAETARLLDLIDPERIARLLAGGLPEPLLVSLREAARRTDLPPTVAAVRFGVDGLHVEWIGPVSPALLAGLMLARELRGNGGQRPLAGTSPRADGRPDAAEIPD